MTGHPEWLKEIARRMIPSEGREVSNADIGILCTALMMDPPQEPVDPDVLLARKIAADWLQRDGDPMHAKVMREGLMDSGIFQTALAGIKAADKRRERDHG